SDLLLILAGPPAQGAVHLAALDMLAQAEHGPGSLVVALACEAGVADALAGELDPLLEGQRAALALVEMAGPKEALELANAFAPEHLQLIGSDAESLAPRVRTAGCVFVGQLA